MSISQDKDNSSRPFPEDLQTSETRYRRLFESARDGILILDADTRKITDVNPYMMELLDYSREEFLGKELWEIGVLKDKEESLQAFKDLKIKDYIRYDDLPLSTKSGSMREVEFVSNVYLENGRSVIQCNIRDITENKRSERALRKIETDYRNFVESSPGIVYLNEPNPPYSTIYVSPNIRAYGYSPEEWYATPGMWSGLVHPEDREHVFAKFKLAANLSLETELEYRILAKNGTIHWWQDKGRFVLDEKGNRTGWQGIILDITATKELEEQLRQAQKLESIGLLAGGIAHDFNNMLTAINGYAELTLIRMKRDDPLRENIEEIINAGQRSATLTHQLLAFSRRQVLQPKVIDLNVAITDTIRMLQRLIGEDIQLTASLDAGIGKVLVDPGQFSQIIMNLVVNARDAMSHGGGKLTIETSNVSLDQVNTRQRVDLVPGAYIMMAVSDTGTGMNDETIRHIFEPFFTMKEVGDGTGLGLATVYGIVKQSGGIIEVLSKQGVGTTFKVYFPLFEAEISEPSVKQNQTEKVRGNETILLVEDEDIVRNLSKRILRECGYTVIEAINGAEALSIFETGDHRIDLLITDVVMPKMGGRELAEKMRAKLPSIRILFTSGYTDDDVVRRGVIETNTNFLQKPFTPSDFTDKIRNILDNASL